MLGGGFVNNKFYALDEVAEMLSVRPEMVWEWIQSGKLRSMRLGKRTVRIMDADLQEFINRLRGVITESHSTKVE